MEAVRSEETSIYQGKDGVVGNVSCGLRNTSLIGSKIDVDVDEGVRRGADVSKVLTPGANAIGLGRPILHVLSAEWCEWHSKKNPDVARRAIDVPEASCDTNMRILRKTTTIIFHDWR